MKFLKVGNWFYFKEINFYGNGFVEIYFAGIYFLQLGQKSSKSAKLNSRNYFTCYRVHVINSLYIWDL